MGCLRKYFLLFVSAAALVACGPDDSTKNNGKNNTFECTSNADCEGGGVCDLSTNTCQGGSTNNPMNNTTSNNTTPNNTSNNTTPNNTSSGPECGNGIVEDGETCDGDCPTSCDNGDACSIGTLNGLAENCTAECIFGEVTACNNGDGCCAEGCTSETDDDCEAMCGNGVLDAGEDCDFGIQGGDGTCPVSAADCNDMNACTEDFASGEAGMCTAMCVNEPIFTCVDGDGCCPGACDSSNDNDCSPKVGQQCTDNGQCPATGVGEGFCMTEADWRWPGGFCTGGCNTDMDCDAGSHCTGRACVPDCTTNDDCRQGYQCYDYYGTGRNTCAPTPGTAEQTGAACTGDADCLGSLFGATCFEGAGTVDGYCVSGCQVDADCAADAHCATLSDNSQICLPNCAGNQDCRNGYECFDWLGDSQNTCGPVANGNGVVGDACTALQDCSGGQDGLCIETPDWDGGYCALACGPNTACPADTHCAFVDNLTGQGICLADCGSAADCRTNYSCEDVDEDTVTECAPSGNGAGAVGDSCAGVFDCGGGVDAACIQPANGFFEGYCSIGCTTDADCGGGAHCGAISATTGEGFCLTDCVDDTGCRADGYRCYEWDDSDPASLECAPAGTGTLAEGDACDGLWECAGGDNALCLSEDSGWTGGYCSDFGCTSDADCGTNAHCAFISQDTGEGFCMDNCATDADCRAAEGYSCFDLDADSATECLPEGDRGVGEPCENFGDCAGRELAICAADPDWPSGYCVLNCTDGNSCPAGSLCVEFGPDFSGCLSDCASNADCRPGYTCTMVDFAGNTACVP